jgi:hypothetical protein
MPQLDKIQLNLQTAKDDLAKFKAFLQTHHYFTEKDVVKHLKAKPHLCCLISAMFAGVPRADVYKFEFQIQGAFRADLIVGNSQLRKFMLVEFEGGQENSLFGPLETNQMRDWSKEIGHGFGQLVDWGWAIHDGRHTTILQNNFGCADMAVRFLLVCGRDSGMNATERTRLSWRADHVRVERCEATVLSYDGLFEFFQSTLEAISSYHDVHLGLS